MFCHMVMAVMMQQQGTAHMPVAAPPPNATPNTGEDESLQSTDKNKQQKDTTADRDNG